MDWEEPSYEEPERARFRYRELVADGESVSVLVPVAETPEDIAVRQAAQLTRLADTAILVSQRALEQGDPQMCRAAGQILGIALDKYLLLTGQATKRSEKAVRFETMPPAELQARASALRDEILARQKHAGGSIGKAVKAVIQAEAERDA